MVRTAEAVEPVPDTSSVLQARREGPAGGADVLPDIMMHPGVRRDLALGTSHAGTHSRNAPQRDRGAEIGSI